VDSEPDLAAAAALVAEPVRAELVLAVLADGPLTASELAARARIARSTASGHLGRLVSGGFLTVSGRGRNRYYELSGTDVAEAIEALSRVAPQRQPRSLREATRNELMREARTCYDHLAGRLGVGLTEALVRRKLLLPRDTSYELTATGAETLAGLGVDVAGARSRQRAFARACLDWSERRPHLAGSLGAALADALLANGWLRRRPNDRALTVTPRGRSGLGSLGVELG
jgi:DNA-binding transcriptional ArsR family regulator